VWRAREGLIFVDVVVRVLRCIVEVVGVEREFVLRADADVEVDGGNVVGAVEGLGLLRSSIRERRYSISCAVKMGIVLSSKGAGSNRFG
jgi:hypothetical protein